MNGSFDELDMEREEDLNKQIDVGICGRCGKTFKWDMNDGMPDSPQCGAKDWAYDDTSPEGCFDLPIQPLR